MALSALHSDIGIVKSAALKGSWKKTQPHPVLFRFSKHAQERNRKTGGYTVSAHCLKQACNHEEKTTDFGLTDKVAVVTGASAGIGLAVARGLAAEGADLVLVARQAERLNEAAQALSSEFGIRAVGAAADIATSGGVDAVLEMTTREFGGADILINNAGTGSNETIMEADDSKWQFYWDLHVMAAVRLARGLVPGMKSRGGGVILHNASICAAQPLWYEPIYNVTKAALMMFSKTLSTEVIKDNIRVNYVNPGLILTPDWIKTAKQLTEETGGDWEAYLQSVADSMEF